MCSEQARTCTALTTSYTGRVSSGLEEKAPRCRECEDCDDQRETVSPGAPSWESIPELGTPQALSSFPDLQQTDEDHIADPDGILASYAFDTDVLCSLRGRHPHQKGLVVRTLCGLVLAMGMTCGKKHILGFHGIVETSRKRSRFHANLRAITDWVPRAKRRLDLLDRQVKGCDDVASTLKQCLPGLYSELRQRRKDKGKGEEVFLYKPGAKPERKKTDENGPAGPTPTARLVGLAILDNKRPALSHLRKLVAQFEECEREAPPIDGPSAENLRAIGRRFEERAEALASWVQEAAQFLSESNLTLALAAINAHNPQVERQARHWKVSHMNHSALLPIHTSWQSTDTPLPPDASA